jgi:signal transducing adaptor molecule
MYGRLSSPCCYTSLTLELLLVYEQQHRTPFPQPRSSYPRAESRAQGQQVPGYGQPADQPQPYGWNPSAYDQPGYSVFPGPAPAYAQQRQGGPVPDPRANLGRSGSYAARPPQPHGQPPSQQVQQTPQPHVQAAYSQPYPPQDSAPSYYPQAQPQQAEAPLQPQHTPSPAQSQNQQSLPHAQQQSHIQSQLQPTPSQTSLHAHPQTQSVPHKQPQAQTQTAHSSSADLPTQAQAQAQAQPQVQKQMTGPPFVFDANATYPDQNVQAWAQYYAQGGTDPTGSVYFISVPGITDAQAPPVAAAVQPAEGQRQQQQQQAGSVPASSGAAPTIVTQVRHTRDDSLPNPYGPTSPSSAESAGGFGGGLARHASMPNPYGMNSPSSPPGGDNMGGGGQGGPVSAGPEGPHVGARAPWQGTTLSGQFAQMRVGGEPSVGA